MSSAARPRSESVRNRFVAMAATLALFAGAVACVTVNVNFPESAVQKATDDYVRDIYRSKRERAAPAPSASERSSGLWNRLVPSAMAEDVSFQLESPKIDTIKDKMKDRVSQIISHKKDGVLGETNDGKLVIHDPAKLKPLLKKKVEDLVKDENRDRDALYQETIEIPSNHLTKSNLPQVRRSFMKSFQAESPSGTWVQSQDGAWSQKP